MNNLLEFLKAQAEAEENGESSFVCPICGGTARWQRVKLNNHLYAGCEKCGAKVME